MISLDHIRMCLEGWVPATLATCGSEGIPNISYVSQVHYVDSNHVALTFQFFNKTHQNILANPQATLLVIDPLSAAQYRLTLQYRRTEEAGALFESMKAKLAGIASSSGMENVFRLLGADIYQVMDIEAIPCTTLPIPANNKNILLALRQIFFSLTGATDLAELFALTLDALKTRFNIHHAMLLLADSQEQKLYTLDTIGYAQSGVGSEVPFGYGVIGTAAKYQTPIRISHRAAEYNYVQAMRAYLRDHKDLSNIETSIAFPGLAQPHSQMAIPIDTREGAEQGKLLGILYVESPQDQYFTFDDEDALASLAILLGQLIAQLRPAEAATAESSLAISASVHTAMTTLTTTASIVRCFTANHSIFLDQDYLIKGVAGAILWRLLQIAKNENRTRFSNRELRLDKLLKLPDIDDNLEARLILLRRRLGERCDFIQIEKTGRGAFDLVLKRPIELLEINT